MNKLYILLLWLCSPTMVSGQEFYDKFWQKLDDTQDHPGQVKAWQDKVSPIEVGQAISEDQMIASYLGLDNPREFSFPTNLETLQRIIGQIELSSPQIALLFRYHIDPKNMDLLDQLVEAANERTYYRESIYLLIKRARYLTYENRIGDSIEKLSQARVVAQKFGSELDNLRLMTELSIVLEHVGSRKKAIEVFNEIDKSCIEPKYRFICLNSIFNKAVAFANSDDLSVVKRLSLIS